MEGCVVDEVLADCCDVFCEDVLRGGEVVKYGSKSLNQLIKKIKIHDRSIVKSSDF